MRLRLLLSVPAAALGLLATAPSLHAQAPFSGADAAALFPGEESGTERSPLAGRSGSLRVALLHPLAELDPATLAPGSGTDPAQLRWVPLFDTRPRVLGTPVHTGRLEAPASPGVWRLEDGGSYVSAKQPLTFITQVPFREKVAGRVNGYRMGSWPTEASDRDDRYAPPAGFIEVTPGNQDLQVSENFRLRQFLTKDQFEVWPKYLALDLRLVDKLELVLQELNAMGVRARRMYVMSGFRTPQYNGPGGDGRAALSRHMYGDASDVWVDDDGDGYIDDLNGDGLSDIRDAEVMMRAVERVEHKHPELVGGAGLYEANSAHGPFVHIDVRGARSRW